MRVNARFEGEAEQQLNFLAEATGLGVSEVLRTSVQRYYEQVRAQRSGLAHFSAFIGRGHSGRSDIAGSYKARLAEGWAAKHQGQGLAPGTCRTLGVDSENAPQRGQFLPDSPPHSETMGQEAGEKWTAAARSQPTIPKSDRLLTVHEPAPPPWPAPQSAQPPQSMQAATPPSAPALPAEPAKSAAGADATKGRT